MENGDSVDRISLELFQTREEGRKRRGKKRNKIKKEIRNPENKKPSTIRSSKLALLLLSLGCPTCYCSHSVSVGISPSQYVHPIMSNSSLQTNPKTIWSASRKWDCSQPVLNRLQNRARVNINKHLFWMIKSQ